MGDRAEQGGQPDVRELFEYFPEFEGWLVF